MVRSKSRNVLAFAGKRDGEGFMLRMVQKIGGERWVGMEMSDIETNTMGQFKAML